VTGRRLLVVADASPLERHGGAARVIREQSRRLAGRGHRVTVLARHPGGDVPLRGHLDSVPVVHYPVDRRHPLAFGLTSLTGARRAFRELGGGQGWDAVIFHQPFSAAAIAALLPSAVRRLYVFHSPAGAEFTLRAQSPNGGPEAAWTPLGALVLRRLERRAVGSVGTIIVLSEFSRRVLEETHERLAVPVVLIPGGVDLERFRPPVDRAGLRERLGWPATGPVLLTVRDLQPRMGIDTLVRALQVLRARRELTCVIGGQGPLRPHLEGLARDLGLGPAVRFVGHVAEEVLPLHYQAAELFVLPTRVLEGFGLVTIEALACGTPVVATPVGATPEILGPLEPRLLAADGTPGALAEAIAGAMTFAADPPFRRRCREYVESRYSWERHVHALECALAADGGGPP
jgi:glycosyltransferase involved in cell wall biosynthesis